MGLSVNALFLNLLLLVDFAPAKIFKDSGPVQLLGLTKRLEIGKDSLMLMKVQFTLPPL